MSSSEPSHFKYILKTLANRTTLFVEMSPLLNFIFFILTCQSLPVQEKEYALSGMFPDMEDVALEYGEYAINGPWNSDIRPMYHNLQDKDDESTESGINRASRTRIKFMV